MPPVDRLRISGHGPLSMRPTNATTPPSTSMGARVFEGGQTLAFQLSGTVISSVCTAAWPALPRWNDCVYSALIWPIRTVQLLGETDLNDRLRASDRLNTPRTGFHFSRTRGDLWRRSVGSPPVVVALHRRRKAINQGPC